MLQQIYSAGSEGGGGGGEGAEGQRNSASDTSRPRHLLPSSPYDGAGAVTAEGMREMPGNPSNARSTRHYAAPPHAQMAEGTGLGLMAAAYANI